MNLLQVMKKEAVMLAGGVLFLAAATTQAGVFTLGSFSVSTGGNGYTTSGGTPYYIQAQNQSGATGTYIKAMGQTFTTPDSSGAPIALTAFSLNLWGSHDGNDAGNSYALQFNLYSSSDRSNLLATQTGTYYSWGYNSHWTCPDPGDSSNQWMFRNLSVGSQPVLAGNTQYYYEVEILSSSRDSEGLQVAYRVDPNGDWTPGAAYVVMSDGSMHPQAWWESNPGSRDSAFVAQFTTVPEPASLGLLALGALGFLHRRRR